MRKLLIAALAAFLIAGCSPENPEKANKGGEWQTPTKTGSPSAEPQKPPESGREAFQQLYATARMWAPDSRPVALESQLSETDFGRDGKSAVWRAIFASLGRRAIKPYTWSAGGAGRPQAGIRQGVEDTYSPSNTSTEAWDIAYLKTDSNQAFDVAQKHGGEALTKRDNKLPVTYLLDWNVPTKTLLWHVVYGSTPTRPMLTVEVNATTGAYLRSQK